MKLLLDENLSPYLTAVLKEHGHDALHWIEVGDRAAVDRTIMKWAFDNGFVVLTHDLDFSAILAVTGLRGPSIVQIRMQEVIPGAMESLLIGVLKQFEAELLSGALISVDEERTRVRVLPLTRDPTNQ